uniref:Uncharacterized protein n=1 Tax=Panagrolaimus sp. ES5 TaxID=591445 RepID=A0AC34FFS0_9BILA
MKSLIILCVFAAFCINYSTQRVLKKGAVFADFSNVKDQNQNSVPVIRKKRGIDLSGLGLDKLGLDEDTLKGLTGKIMDLLGGGEDSGTKCQVIINNGGGDQGSQGNDVGQEDKPEPTKECGPHGRLC